MLTLPLAISIACSQIVTPSPIPETLIYTPTTGATSTATELPTSESTEPTATEAPRRLVICTGSELDSLYLYGTSMFISNIVQEADYDGPNSSFASSDTWNIEEYDYGEGCE